MGTIADKLLYLNGTKQSFKTDLNAVGAEITDQTTFRNYLQWLDDLYDSTSEKTRLAEEGIEGNTYQETNANVFDGTLAQTTYTGTGSVVENSPTRFNFINGYTYTINIKFTSNNVSTIDQNRILGIRTYKDIGYTGRGVIINSDNLSSGTGSITFTVEENYNSFSFINYADFQSGTITITDFEIITNTPAPDYPQEIVNISGKSNVKVVGKNLFDKNAITERSYVLNDGTLQTGTSYEYNTSDFIPVQPNTTYYKTLSLSPRTKFYDANKQVLDSSTYQDISIGGNAGTFTTPANAYYFRFTINTNVSTGVSLDSVMVHKGSEVSTYEPYQEQSFDLDLKSKNLFDGQTAKTKGSYDANATLMTIQLQPNTQYTFSRIVNTTFARDNGYYLYFVKNEDTSTRIFDLMHLSMTDPITSGIETITTGASGIIKLIGVYAYPERVQNYFNNVNVQIEKGSTATEYEPYYDINLCKIGDYKDRIYPLNGKWYLEKKIGKKIYVATDFTIAYGNAYSNVTYTQFDKQTDNIQYGNYNYPTIAPYFDKAIDMGMGRPINDWDSYIRDYLVYNSPMLVNYWMSFAKDTPLSTIRKKLDGLIMYYVLAEPTTEEITESNYPTLYNQLQEIQDYLIQYKINKEFLLGYAEPSIEIQ